MPRNIIGDAPFPPVVVFDHNRDVSIEDLRNIISQRQSGVSVCVRYPYGPETRGGYFFHFSPHGGGTEEFQVMDFEARPVKVLNAESLVAFINHCTGRSFHEPSFILCQTELNFLNDEEPNV